MILSDYAIKFRTAVFVFVVVLVIVGAYSYVTLPREGTPDITIPYVFVSAHYEGTAPEEMEKLVAIPLEKSLSDVENVKELRSISAEGSCAITLEFLAGQDIDLARQRVKDKVDLSKPNLPDDLDEPVVAAFNFSSDFPVYILAISGNTTLARLKNLAEELQEEIELLPGVKQAVISGTREREIRVEVDLPRLVAYGIPLPVVMQRIASENSTISAGSIEMSGSKFQVRVPGEFTLVSEIRDIMLVERGGRPVYLRDVASVTDTHKDLQSISRLNGELSVSIDVKKRVGVNAVSLIEQIKEITSRYMAVPDIRLTEVMDQSEYVHMMINELENNVASGFLLVMVVLFIFMGMRNSLFVAAAIPLSMLIAFTAMAFAGRTLNMIVLFSLVLAVGMLVDNAIVIVENIYRNRTAGLSRTEAARRGVSEVAWPVMTSTLTTCAAFSPLLFWPDMMGQFMGFLPRTVIIVLLASLFVAMVINPAVCAALISGERKRRPGDGKPEQRAFVRGYEKILGGALSHPVPVLLTGILVLVATVQAYDKFGKGKELFPEVEPRNATVSLRFPQGTSVEKTDAAVAGIEKKLAAGMGEPEGKYRDIKFFLTTVGQGVTFGPWGGGGGANVGNIHVEFLEAEKRAGNTTRLVDELRKDIGSIPGADITVGKEEMGPPTGAPISIEISGDDFGTLSILAKDISRSVKAVPGLVDLQDDLEDALPELQFRVDKRRATLLGLDTDTIGIFLRAAIYGLESSKFRVDEEEYDITVRLPESQRDSVAALDRVFIPVASGGAVPLSSVGKVAYVGGKGAISRKDRKRVVTVTGNNEKRGVDKILEDVKPVVDAVDLPPGYAVKYAGDTEEMQEAVGFLSKAFAVALGLIIVILVIQFNSVLLPGVIVISVVLSLIGVMWGLLICRLRFGVIMTFLGVISLAGVVVNNAIVLVDCILRRREEGLSARDAIIAAGRIRLRPVLLTATTTILGLIPMAIGYSLEIHEWPPRIIAGAETSSWWAPMAVAVIFGLGVATILTLVLVPVMYSLADSLTTRLLSRMSPG